MIHWHSLDRAARYYAQRTALASADHGRSTFRELYDRVAGLAALLARRGVSKGDRLALLLPNGPEYIELVYACSWLGAIAVPLNTRLSATEIDRVLVDSTPRGLIRHSSMPDTTTPKDIERVLLAKHAPATRNRALCAFRGLFGWAVRQGHPGEPGR